MKARWWVGIMVGVLAVYPAAGWTLGRAHKEPPGQEHAGKEHTGSEHAGKERAGEEPAHEHAGQTQEHGSQEHAGQLVAQAEPSAEQIRQAIRDRIELLERENGAFTIHDEFARSERTLKLVQVHERVGKTGQFYYACTDMRDEQTGELLDLDFDVNAEGGEPSVVDVWIHKVNDQPRYTYDEQDNRIPLAPGA